MPKNISTDQVHHISELANIPVTDDEAAAISKSFDETLEVVKELMAVDVSSTEPTHQVTGLENVLREDIVDEEKMFSQEEALANAKRTHEGFFVVPRIIDEN